MHRRYAVPPAQATPKLLRCTTCGAVMVHHAGHGQTPDRWACSVSSYHPRTDRHPHQLRELRALAIRPERLTHMVGLVEDNLGVLAGEMAA